MLRKQVSMCLLRSLADPSDGQTRRVATKSAQILSQPVYCLQLIPKTNISREARKSHVTQGSLAGVDSDENQVLVYKNVRIYLWRGEKDENRQGGVGLGNPKAKEEAVFLATDSVTGNLEAFGARPACRKSLPSLIALRPLKPKGDDVKLYIAIVMVDRH